MIEHSLVKATIIPVVIKMIQEKYSLSEEDAFNEFYLSRTAKNLSDESTGLYGQSPLFIFSLFEEEKQNSNN